MLTMTEEDFDLVIDVNLKGTFLVTQVLPNPQSLIFLIFSPDRCESVEREPPDRLHSQHLQHSRQDRLCRELQLHRQQGGSCRLHQNCGQGTGQVRDPRQCHPPWLHQDTDDRHYTGEGQTNVIEETEILCLGPDELALSNTAWRLWQPPRYSRGLCLSCFLSFKIPDRSCS